MPSLVSLGTITALVAVIAVSVWLGTLAQKVVEKGSFVQGYFLGNRGLGVWALALTATVQSGGTFMGFPSLVYSHGWVGALFIAGYMVVPLTGFAVLGKRFAQLSRHYGAITVPDLFRSRFDSPLVGIVASLFIMFFMSVMMMAQFKAGAVVMKIAWPGSNVLSFSEESTYRLSDEQIQRLATEPGGADVVPLIAHLAERPFASGSELEEQLKLAMPGEEFASQRAALVSAAAPFDWLFYLGLAVFTLTVVGYTLIGGFLASVWTDLFQSVLMLAGVLLLIILTLTAVARQAATQGTDEAGGPPAGIVATLDYATSAAVDAKGPAYAAGPGYSRDGRAFLPVTLAVSYFSIWVLAGMGSPASLVRVMACRSTETIRRSIFVLAIYNTFIYLPLILICICGRALLPDLAKSDEIVPRLAILTTQDAFGSQGLAGLAGSFLAGLILAAPFGAVMATVSTYLVVIASGVVRDVYQRWINPQASERRLKQLTYTVTILVGAIAVAANINPIDYLQVLVVSSSTAAAATFLVPAFMAAYWRRATSAGVLAAMLAGATTMMSFYVFGSLVGDHPLIMSWLGENPLIGPVSNFRPYYLLGMDPIVYGLAASLVFGVAVSLWTPPPRDEVVSPLFERPA